MLDSTRSRQALKLTVPALLLIWAFAYLNNYESTYHAVLRTFKDQKSVFVADFLEHEIDGQFDGSGLAALCASKTWTPNLFLSCDPAPGGVGQVKNAHLTCIRLAIEMGGPSSAFRPLPSLGLFRLVREKTNTPQPS